MQARWPINWVLISALLALVVGLIVEPMALKANDQRLRRGALHSWLSGRI